MQCAICCDTLKLYGSITLSVSANVYAHKAATNSVELLEVNKFQEIIKDPAKNRKLFQERVKTRK